MRKKSPRQLYLHDRSRSIALTNRHLGCRRRIPDEGRDGNKTTAAGNHAENHGESLDRERKGAAAGATVWWRSVKTKGHMSSRLDGDAVNRQSVTKAGIRVRSRVHSPL